MRTSFLRVRQQAQNSEAVGNLDRLRFTLLADGERARVIAVRRLDVTLSFGRLPQGS